VIAGEYFDYAELLEKDTKGGYDRCPQECPENRQKRYDVNRSDLCKTCPKRKHWKTFKEETIERWRKWFGESESFNFDEMLKTFYNVVTIENLTDDRLLVKNASLVSVLRSERTKAERRGAGG
jgi:hypothetical protein